MARKKSAPKKPIVTQELSSILFGWLIAFFVVCLIFIDPDSTLGLLLMKSGLFLYGKAYLFIQLSVLLPLALFLMSGKLRWNIERIIGVMMYLVAMPTFLGIVSHWSDGARLNFSEQVITMLGKVPGFVLMIAFISTALYLSLRISYRHIIHKVSNSASIGASVSRESVSRMRDIIIGSRDEEFADDIAHDSSKSTKKTTKLKIEAKEQSTIDDIKSHQTKKQSFIESRLKEIQAQLSGGKNEEISADVHSGEEKESNKVNIRVPVREKSSASAHHRAMDNEDRQMIHEEPNSPMPEFADWIYPSIEHLKHVSNQAEVSSLEIEKRSLEIQETLLKFRIDVDMKGALVGPTVIQYRLAPSEGVKLSRIENLKKDLALALKAKTLRIQAPIPGLGLVGIELPNDKRSSVSLREVIESPVFQNHPSKITMALGKNINGEYVVVDLAKMPHLLIAGQTGSGKSVGMNGFLMSLLYRNSPRDLRMIMIDPKRVELDAYNGIPHLLAPVINDSEKALNALKWSVAEMLRRYDILKAAGVRNLGEYNDRVDRKNRMEYIVIVIDELADLMMSGNKKEVEASIARIAQMARAVGMHLIVATQRPSVDVITGLIKANIPSRIAFTVASQIDSRTVIDRGGAEDLLGMGDLLYYPSGASEAERVQGVFVSTDEVHDVVREIRLTIDPAMLEDLQDPSIVHGDRGNYEGSMTSGSNHDEDPKIIEAAIDLIRKEQKASTSMLQRKLGLGFARAGRIMDILEEMGIVGPADGSKPRQILIS